MDTTSRVCIDLHGPGVLSLASDLESVFREALGAAGYDEPPEAAERFAREQLPRHAERDGFRCAVARADGDVAGFAYGYTGELGQWWSDHVAELAPPEVSRTWVGRHFELVEMAVRPHLHVAGSVGGCRTRCSPAFRTTARCSPPTATIDPRPASTALEGGACSWPDSTNPPTSTGWISRALRPHAQGADSLRRHSRGPAAGEWQHHPRYGRSRRTQ